MASQASKVRRFGKHAFFACVVAMALTALSTYGPIAVAWFKPDLLGNVRSVTYAHASRDFDATFRAGWLARVGYERIAITAIRSAAPYSKPSVDPALADLAERVMAADLRCLGPMERDIFGRGGITLHLHRAGFPLPCVEASIAHVWRGRDASLEALEGGKHIEVPSSSVRASWFPWLIPLHVLPKALAMNLAFWTVVGYGVPLMVRAWIRSRRYKPGHCATCGYDRRGAPTGPCPECGKLGVMPG